MPIEWEIDPARRLVLAWPREEFDTDDLLGYLKAVWTKPEVRGYDEIVDMARATKVIYGSAWKIREITLLAAEMDVPGVATKLAIVANSEQFQELGRMYQAFRAANPKSMKEVLVFATREEALKWLGEAGAVSSGWVLGLALLALPFSFLAWMASVGAVARALAQRQEAAPRRVRLYLAASFALLLGSWIAAAVVYRAIRWPLWWSLPLAAHALHAAAVLRLRQRRVSSPNRENTIRS